MTPLHAAALNLHVEVEKVLVSSGDALRPGCTCITSESFMSDYSHPIRGQQTPLIFEATHAYTSTYSTHHIGGTVPA